MINATEAQIEILGRALHDFTVRSRSSVDKPPIGKPDDAYWRAAIRRILMTQSPPLMEGAPIGEVKVESPEGEKTFDDLLAEKGT